MTTTPIVSSVGHEASSEAFVFLRTILHMTVKQKTIVYVDGFNLYYGALRKTKYKWLDLVSLFNKLLSDQHLITEIKYFTARVSARNGDQNIPNRQNAYLKALEMYAPKVSIYYGHYLTNLTHAKVHNPSKGAPKVVTIVKTEEKGSDVNIALHILNDAWLNKYDCAVLVSNDSDIAEALRLAKEDHNKKIGLIIPGHDRYPSKALMKYMDFMKIIRPTVLANSQLPNPISGSNIYKPSSW